jgi:hemolysin activation/secretion protein
MKSRSSFGHSLLKIVVATLGLAMLASKLPAQDFNHIAPKQPAKPAPGSVVNDAQNKPMAAGGDDQILVGQLKGIVLLSNPKQVRPEGVSGRRSIEPGDVAFAARPDFAAVVQPYLGQPVMMKSLAELTRSIVAYYRSHDRPVVNVYVPQQRITSGYVQIVVVESRVEKVSATGAHYFSNEMLRREIQLRPGDPIRGDLLRENLSWINRNPFLQSDVLMAPGDAPGTTDLLLRTQDRFPFRIYAGYENSGNRFTGEDRILGGFNYGNLFGVGQQVSYQYTQAPDVNQFSAHSGTYIIPLPWHHLLTFFGSYASTDATLDSHFNSGGVNWQVSGRYEIPLPSTAQFTESVTGGLDFKRSNDNLLFGVASVSNSTTDIDQLVLGYQAGLQDDHGSTAFSATGFWSPGGISAYDNDTDYVQQRAGSRDNYEYGQFTLDRVTRLPLDFSWTVRGELQESSANLQPSEQLGLGGYETVRGYEEREVNGDDGFLISTEVATPPVSIGDFLGIPQIKDQLQFLGFVDYGGTTLHHVTPSDINPDTNLLGVGPGVRYAITPYLSVRFDYGFQLIKTGFGNGEHSRGNIGVVISY